MSYLNAYLVMLSFISAGVFTMGHVFGSGQYHHDTREGTIACEGAESIIYDEKIYCLNKDNE